MYAQSLANASVYPGIDQGLRKIVQSSICLVFGAVNRVFGPARTETHSGGSQQEPAGAGQPTAGRRVRGSSDHPPRSYDAQGIPPTLL